MPYANKDRQREYQRLYVAKRRADFFLGKRCCRCGTGDELVLHHRDPTLKESHKIWTWSQKRQVAEIVKCDVLCDTCHREHHSNLSMTEHGTIGRYERGCRCASCKVTNRDRVRKQRKQRESNGHRML